MNMEKFKNTLKRFAEHLHNLGETKAAEAVETILKSVERGMFDEDKKNSEGTNGDD